MMKATDLILNSITTVKVSVRTNASICNLVIRPIMSKKRKAIGYNADLCSQNCRSWKQPPTRYTCIVYACFRKNINKNEGIGDSA